MAKVHKSVGNGRGEIKADSISLRLYTIKLQPLPEKQCKIQYFPVSTPVLSRKYSSTLH